MRIAVLGGGPAGLYFAYLWKRRHPQSEVTLYEQNPADATWGFGVVLSERALEFLRVDDPETADLITLHLENWRNMTLDLRGERVVLDGIGFSAIGRLKLLQLLQQRVYSVGIEPRFHTPVRSLRELRNVDLLSAPTVSTRLCVGDLKVNLQHRCILPATSSSGTELPSVLRP